MEPVTVERELIVRGGSLGSVSWVVKNAEQIDGRDFAILSRSDTGMCRFILGKSQKSPMRDYVFLDKLRAMRNSICAVDLRVGLGDGQLSQYATRQALKRSKISGETQPSRDHIVSRELPAFTYNGIDVPATTIAFKRVENKLEAVSIEFEAEALFYIKMATLSHGVMELPRTRDKDVQHSKEVHWRKDKGAWVAFRDDGRSKTFRPTGDPGSSDSIFEAAQRWADGEDGGDADGDRNAVEPAGSLGAVGGVPGGGALAMNSLLASHGAAVSHVKESANDKPSSNIDSPSPPTTPAHRSHTVVASTPNGATSSSSPAPPATPAKKVKAASSPTQNVRAMLFQRAVACE